MLTARVLVGASESPATREHGAFLGGLEAPAEREHGTGLLLDGLEAFLADEVPA